MDRERFDASGRECPGPGVLTWRGGLREAEAIGVPLAASVRGGASPEGQVPEEAGGKPATGPGLFPASLKGRARGGSPGRACGGHGGPEAAGQGPCRNPRQKHLSRSVRIAAGAIRAEGPEEGQVDKPIFVSCRPPPVGCRTASGAFRAARAQRHPRMRDLCRSPHHPYPSQRHCPRAALRTIRLSRESTCT
jgi:hypothetical protein